MKYKALLGTALLTLAACSGSADSSPSTAITDTTTISQTTTTASTTTIPSTTTTDLSTTTTTTTTTAVPTATSPPPTVDLAHPAEADFATWTVVLNALAERELLIYTDPANTSVDIYAVPGSARSEQITKTRNRLLTEGTHVEGRAPNKVESIQQVVISDNLVRIDFTLATNESPGRLVNSSGVVQVENQPAPGGPKTVVLSPADDPALPWRVGQWIAG